MTKAKPPAKPAAKPPASPTSNIRTADEELEAILGTLTGPQRARVKALLASTRSSAPGPNMKLSFKGKVLEIGYDHESSQLAAALTMADLGTIDPAFLTTVVKQIATIGSYGNRVDQDNSNFLLSVVRAVQPRDGLETLLAMQMGAIHSATMMMARRLNHVENLPQQDAAERALNKLARTYAAQMEALKRYRSKGEQRVIVERVTVNKGGQAIVGAVSHGGEGEA